MTKPKIEWLSGGGPNDPVANILLDGERIGRVRYEGIGYVWYVRGRRAGGYANINQLLRDAAKWHRKQVAELASVATDSEA